VKEFMALFPTDKILAITLDYIANDPELHKVIVYIQSKEFPIIHTAVQYLKQYKDVSSIMCMFFKSQSDTKIYVQFLLVSEFLFPSA